MAPLIYPEPTWSNRFGSVVRTLQVIAIAGAIGAVGGGVAVIALVGAGSSQRHITVLKASTADDAPAQPAKAAPAVQPPQPPAAAAAPQPKASQPKASQPKAVAPARAAPPVVPAPTKAAEASPQQSATVPEPSAKAAAGEQHPVQQATANPPADANVYNRVEPEQTAVKTHASRSRPKVSRRTRAAERGRAASPVQRDYDGRTAQRSEPYPRGRRYADEPGGAYAGDRYSYRDYDAPRRVVRIPPPMGGGYYFGSGGGIFDRGGNWGD
jgi:hypothetical protein